MGGMPRPRPIPTMAMLAALTIAGSTCSPDDSTTSTGGAPAQAVVSFATGEGRVSTSRLPVADSESERQRGLMGRRALPPDGGMLFSFGSPTSEGFWMKDTAIPLSIAFWDERERVIAILDMPPCLADPCVIYRPNAPYTAALEMRRGWFDRHGVSIGDRVELTDATS
jgi:uncharacterized protein